MRKLSISLLLVLTSQFAFSQYTESITTSRPGQAFAPLTVGKKVFQLQTGLNFNGTRFDVFEDKDNGVAYSALFRYGIWEKIEFRTQFGLSRITSKPPEVTNNGLSSLSFGTKINLLNGEGKSPKIGLQGDFFIPAVSEDFKTDKVATTVILSHTQGITENLGVSTNFGISWDGNGSDAVGIYVINLGFPIGQSLSGFVETYGFIQNSDFDVLFDGGFAYSVNDHIVVDLSAGYGKNDGEKQFFVDFGVSWRTIFGG